MEERTLHIGIKGGHSTRQSLLVPINEDSVASGSDGAVLWTETEVCED